MPVTERRIPCERCPLRVLPHFRPFTPEELHFVSSFKQGELLAEAGSMILAQGTHSAHLFTLLSGSAFRYKMLEDGRRQILNYLFPGDLVGLQGSIMGEMDHSVEALSNVVLCVFQRDKLDTLYNNHPGLGFDITWLAAREERMLDDHLISVGRRSAVERAAYLLAFLHDRAAQVGLVGTKPFRYPVRQQHIADTLGLSIVHTNKTLRRLSERGLVRWLDRGFEVLDVVQLRAVAGWDGLSEGRRPLI